MALDVALDATLDVTLDACRTVRREKSIESGLLNVSETKVKSKKLPDLKFFSVASQRASSYCSTIVGLLYSSRGLVEDLETSRRVKNRRVYS